MRWRWWRHDRDVEAAEAAAEEQRRFRAAQRMVRDVDRAARRLARQPPEDIVERIGQAFRARPS